MDDAPWRLVAAAVIISSAMKASSSRLPVSVLTELRNSQIQPKTFAAMLRIFGHLPEGGQYELAGSLIRAAQVYRLRKLVEKQQHVPNRKHLHSINTSARRILKLLGVDDAKSVKDGVPRGSMPPTATYLLIQLYSVGVERRRATAHVDADERMRNLILLLSDLVEAAEQLTCKVSHGGPRRAGPTAEVELYQAIIASYDGLRRQFPSSGPQLAFDQRLKKFIRLGLRLAVTSTFVVGFDAEQKPHRHQPPEMAAVDASLSKESRTTDDALRGAYERYRTTDQGKKST